MRDTRKIARELMATRKWSEPTISVAEIADYCCEYCDLDFLASPENLKLLQCDHIVPKVYGGEDKMDNLVVACRHCNCDWKSRWNPRSVTGAHASREELIVAVRVYVKAQRERARLELDDVRSIVGYRRNRNPNVSTQPALAGGGKF